MELGFWSGGRHGLVLVWLPTHKIGLVDHTVMCPFVKTGKNSQPVQPYTVQPNR